MFQLIVCFILTLQLNSILSLDEISDDLVSLNIEDNISDRKFLSFSKVNVRLSRQSTLELSSTRTVSSVQYERMLEEIQENVRSFYSVKVHFKRRSVQDYVMTSIPTCLILQAQFRYTINLFINENGYIVSMNIVTDNSTCSLSSTRTPSKVNNDLTYKVTLNLHFNRLGPQPEVQHFLEKLKREREAKLNSQENDNRPFVLKYWKYILPAVIILVLQGVFTDPGAAGGR